LCRSSYAGIAIGAQLKRIVKERSSPASGLRIYNKALSPVQLRESNLPCITWRCSCPRGGQLDRDVHFVWSVSARCCGAATELIVMSLKIIMVS
jgi:hypothetical protein